MGLEEYLSVVVGDIGHLITGTFHFLEFLLGLSYYAGETLSKYIFAFGSFFCESALQIWDILKIINLELWDFGGELFKGLLLIYYAIWMVFESFYVVTTDLSSFSVHVFLTVGQHLNDTQNAIVGHTSKAFSIVPYYICQSLMFIGERAILFFQTIFLILVDFMTQLVMAPVKAVQSFFLVISQIFDIPFYLFRVWESLSNAEKAGVFVIFLISVIYWKVKLAQLPRRAWNLSKLVGKGGLRTISLLKNSRQIVNQVLNWDGESIASNNADSRAALCVVCQDATVSFLAIPCRHLCLCHSCVKTLIDFDHRCPLCRGAVKKFERVYIPM